MLIIAFTVTGCDGTPSDTITDTITRVESGTVEPQGNQRDYLLQDYDTKKPKDLKKDKLKKFDVSGPDYAGITEIVNNMDLESDTELKEDNTTSFCLSAYHCTTTNAIAGRMCVSPDKASDVLKAFKDTSFYKDGDYTTSSDVNEFLTKLEAYVARGSQSSQTTRQQLVAILNSLTVSDVVRPVTETAANTDYKKETKVIGLIETGLNEKSVKYTDTVSNNDTYARYSLAEYATLSGVGYHIIISYKESQQAGSSTSTDGWMIYYKNDSHASGKSKLLAEKIVEALREDSSIVEAKSKIDDKTFDGCRNMDEYYGTKVGFPILNYEEIPAVLVVLNSGKSDNSAESIGADILKAIDGGIQ